MDNNSPVQNPVPAPMSPTPTASGAFQLPAQWPGAFGIYQLSKTAVKVNLGTLLTLFILNILVSGVTNRIGGLGDLIGSIIQIILSVGIITTSYASLDSTKISVSQAIAAGFSKLGVKMFFLSLLLLIISVGTFILLIVPWVIVFPRIVLAPYLMIKKNLGIIDSIQQSWDLTKGHNGKVWGVIGASILYALLCIILIGFYFSFMYIAAWVILTTYLLRQQATAPVAATPEPAVVPAEQPVVPPAPETQPAPAPQDPGQTPPTA